MVRQWALEIFDFTSSFESYVSSVNVIIILQKPSYIKLKNPYRYRQNSHFVPQINTYMDIFF